MYKPMTAAGRVAPACVALACSAVTLAVDIDGVQYAALDQPRINATVSATGSTPYVADFSGILTFNVEAFYDTGASGVLLSADTAASLGVPLNASGGKNVVFEDVGVAGSDSFYVSTSVDIDVGPFNELTMPDLITAAENEYTNFGTFNTLGSVYPQKFSNIRTQVGSSLVTPPPGMEGLDVFGMPTMVGKVVVMDPKPVNTFADTMRTYTYNPGTSYNALTADTNPGVPATTHHVSLTYVSFDRFTRTSLEGDPTPLSPTEAAAVGPTLVGNPFIGPNPIHTIDASVPAGNNPGVAISFGGQTSTGSWLLDTGAASSMISVAQAAAVGVHYRVGTEGTDTPILVDGFDVPLLNQFTLDIGGVGGVKKTAGFYLTSLLLPTQEGAIDSANNIRFLNAPVLVNDITVVDPITSATLTLDGIFGMNYLVASASLLDLGGGLIYPVELVPSAFGWAVFDQPNGVLGLTIAVPEPTSLGFIFVAGLLLRRERGRRAA